MVLVVVTIVMLTAVHISSGQLSTPDLARCLTNTDIIFLIDGSGTVGRVNFQNTLNAVANLVGQMVLDDQTGTRVAALVFSSAVADTITFTPFHSKIQIQNAIRQMTYPNGGTRTDLAIQKAREIYDVERRPGANKLAIIITDGLSQYNILTVRQANMAKLEGITITSIGVGLTSAIDRVELQQMASGPNLVFQLQDVGALLREVLNIFQTICVSQPQPVINPVIPPNPQQNPTTTTTTQNPKRNPSRNPNRNPNPNPNPTSNPNPNQNPNLNPNQNQKPIPNPNSNPNPRVNPIPNPNPNSRNAPSYTDSLCDGCRYLNGVGFNPINDDCTAFVHCDIRSGMVKMIVRKCSEGLFWHSIFLACTYPSRTDCPADPCKSSGLRSYAHKSNCRMYWTCSNRRTISLRCCPRGQGYERGECTPGAICTRLCKGEIALPHVTTPTTRRPPAACSKQAVPGDLSSYSLSVGGGRWRFECAPGTLYNKKICECDHIANVLPDGGAAARQRRPVRTCTPELLINCNGRVQDSSTNHLPLFVERVSVVHASGARGGGACRFNGDSRILSWRFSNVPFGRDVYARIRYQGDQTNGRVNAMKPEALMVNSDCDIIPSLVIAYDPTSSRTMGRLETGGPPTTIFSSGSSDRWIEATLKYDGRAFALEHSGGTSISEPKSGDVRVCQCGLQIGYTTEIGFSNFTGLIDEVALYFCQPP